MNKGILDTDILSEVLKGFDLRVGQQASVYLGRFGRFTVSAPTVMEIVKGIRKQKQPKKLKQFLARLSMTEVLSFDQTSGEIAGQIDADLEQIGQSIGMIDPMIAAVAIQYRLTLITGNTDHYQRVRALGYELLLDNWRK